MSKTVLAIASGGGHWAEMRRLMPAFDGLDVSYASIRPEYESEALGRPYYFFNDFHRHRKRGAVPSALKIMWIVFKVRPQVVISTGSAPTLVALATAKLFFGAKTIWIDSLANVEHLSSSGKLARYVADIWLTQWPHVATEKGPAYWGAVL